MATASATKVDRLLEDRRKLGAFYTPVPLSDILAQWAIRSAEDCILEPSFGGCGFLQSAFERLAALGAAAPRERIFGCDIDPVAFEYLAQVLGGPVDLSRFLHADFLTVTDGSGWPRQFAAILANPPYIPYQAIETSRRTELTERAMGIEGVGGRASLWAYFIAHAVSLLAPGGRMAWVLPGAFLQADYAAPIRTYLARSFHRAAAIVLHERIFLDEGTDEETVILLADGHGEASLRGQIDLIDAMSLPHLRTRIAEWDDGLLVKANSGRPAALSLSPENLSQVSVLDAHPNSISLAELASVQIGLVMGANRFFVLREEDLEDAGLELDDCTPILGKFQAVQGLDYTADDHEEQLKRGGRGLLAGAARGDPSERLQAYYNRFTAEARANVGTFRKRRIWWRPHDGRIADAFFPVMHHYGPRIVLNPSLCANTNTIHRVYFNKEITASHRKLIAISILTSYSQLKAELVGRRYGSGVLKHEPREAERIRLLIPPTSAKRVDKTFDQINAVLRTGDRTLATQLADQLVYGNCGLSDPLRISANLSEALKAVRFRRRPDRRSRDLKLDAPVICPHDIESC